MTEALWGLSNFTASTEAYYTEAFISEQKLFCKVLCMMSHSHSRIRGEALFTICNAIDSCSSGVLKNQYELHRAELIKPLCNALSKGHDANLILSVLQALKKLLDLDEEYPSSFSGMDSVMTTIEAIGAFDHIDQLTEHKNEDVFKLAYDLIHRN